MITSAVCKGGHTNYFCQSANRESAISWAHSAIANPQISEMCQSSNRKSANCYICGRSANQKNKICGFAICGTYLRTAHLWLYVLYCKVHCTLKKNIFGCTVLYPHHETGAKEFHTFHKYYLILQCARTSIRHHEST